METTTDDYHRGYAEGVRVTREQQYRARVFLIAEFERLLVEHLGSVEPGTYARESD